MRIRGRTKFALLAVLVFGVVALTASAGTATGASATSSSLVPKVGTGGPQTGPFTPWDGTAGEEFAGVEDGDQGPDAYGGNIVDRSLSAGGVSAGVSTTTGKKAKSDPQFNFGFEGLNLFQQRYARGGNQFTVEPPDQGMCAGNGYVVEAVNDVLNVFNQSNGSSALPNVPNVVAGFNTDVNHAVDLNSFYGYAPAIDRAHGNVRAQFVTDPSCLYDAATQRFFVVVLTLESTPAGAFTHVNHLDIAVSQTSNPTGGWNIYKTDVTNDGIHNPSAANACPCLGDYPHIGADANGFYVTTNAYPWAGNGFNGAQIYAYSKAQLAAGAASVNMQHLDTFGLVNRPSDAGSTQPGFTLWPAQSPPNQFNTNNGGTEFLLSSNAADEATRPVAGTSGPRVSSEIVLWTLTNTSSLNSGSGAIGISNKVLSSNQYGVPPKQQQPGSGTAPGTAVPQGHCINDTTTPTIAGLGCWRLLFGGEPAHNEVISRPDSNDSRMQQVFYANGKVWGALDTALNPDGGAQRAGVAWFIVNPNAGMMAQQGYLGATGYDFTYPAIAVTQSGRGVMAFTATGDNTYPSAAYASIDANAGIGAWNIVPGGQGAAVDDGFTSYKSQVGNPPRTRWGDYGAAAVDGNSIWLASEYIAHACDYATWGGRFFGAATGDNKLGTCAASPGAAGLRAALGNWSTFISKFTP